MRVTGRTQEGDGKYVNKKRQIEFQYLKYVDSRYVPCSYKENYLPPVLAAEDVLEPTSHRAPRKVDMERGELDCDKDNRSFSPWQPVVNMTLKRPAGMTLNTLRSSWSCEKKLWCLWASKGEGTEAGLKYDAERRQDILKSGNHLT